jgi:hypothetical protein
MFCHLLPNGYYDIPNTCGPDPDVCILFEWEHQKGTKREGLANQRGREKERESQKRTSEKRRERKRKGDRQRRSKREREMNIER